MPRSVTMRVASAGEGQDEGPPRAPPAAPCMFQAPGPSERLGDVLDGLAGSLSAARPGAIADEDFGHFAGLAIGLRRRRSLHP